MFCLSEYWIFQGQFNSPTTCLGGSGKRFFIIDSLLDQIHWYYVLSLPIFPGGMTIVPQTHTNVWFNKTNSTPKLIYLHKNYANLHLFHSKLLFMLNAILGLIFWSGIDYLHTDEEIILLFFIKWRHMRFISQLQEFKTWFLCQLYLLFQSLHLTVHDDNLEQLPEFKHAPWLSN